MVNKVKEIIAIGIFVLLIGITAISSAIDLDRPINDNSTKMIEESLIYHIPKGNILYVGGSGPNNYTKIQDAIDSAESGDTIFVFSKKPAYIEHIIINKSISLIGQDKNSTKIDPGKDDNVILINANNVIVSNLMITNSYIPHSSAKGIYANNIDNLKITNCNIISNKNSGIEVWSSGNIIITNNLIKSNRDGIVFYYSSNNYVSGNEIFNNGAGIYLESGSNNIIDNNNISSNGVGIYFIHKVLTSKIHNNIITENQAHGIYLQRECSNVNITNNSILNNNKKGIIIKDNSDNNTIYYNIIMGNNDDYDPSLETGGALYIHDSKDTIIIGNKIKFNNHEEVFLSAVQRTKFLHNEIDSKSMFFAILYLKNCNDIEISSNNLIIRHPENRIFVEYIKWGDLNDFIYTFTKLKTLTFSKNYWNRPRLIPKTIIGSYNFKFGFPDDPGFSLIIPYLIFDKNPAKEPYDI